MSRQSISCIVLLLASAVTSAAFGQLDKGDKEREVDELIESEVLKTELHKLVGETLQAAREAGEPVPAELTADKMVARFLPEMRKHRPTFLRVRPDVEKKYEQGKFDDALARARWKAAVKLLADFNVALPKMHQQLLSADKQRPLSGARLELTAQIFEAQVANLMKELEE